jgi:hypothetical protein
MHYGLSAREVRKFASEYAEALNIKMPEGWRDRKMAVTGWIINFLKRHMALSVGKPQITSISRALSFKNTTVKA